MADRQVQVKTNYFPHDSNARNDEKLVRLRMKHGAAGYGVYFMILERLREDAKYMSARDYNMIAYDLRVDAALVKSVVEDFGLFVFADNGKYFYSDSFSRRMLVKDEIVQKRVLAGKQSALKRKQMLSSKGKKAIAAATADKEQLLERFFCDENKASIEVILKNFGMKPTDTPKLRKLAEAVTAEWTVTELGHMDYTDWSRHLIATMRIKLNQMAMNKTANQEPPAAEDYKFGGGFGGKDV